MSRVRFLRKTEFGGVLYSKGAEMVIHSDVTVERLVNLGDVAIIVPDIVLSPVGVTQIAGIENG